MSWGGARKGAGRPARGPVPSEPHKTRPLLAARHPVHVTARLVPRAKPRHHGRSRSATHVARSDRRRGTTATFAHSDRRHGTTATFAHSDRRGGTTATFAHSDRRRETNTTLARSDRRRETNTTLARSDRRRGTDASFARSDLYRALRRALAVSLARANFRVVHLAVRHDRVELVVEADDKLALARGMQGFQVSAAKSLNRFAHRRGTVFRDRYRMRILRTRLEVRDVIGRLPPARREAWPQTWLLRIELARVAGTGRGTRRVARRSTRAPPP